MTTLTVIDSKATVSSWITNEEQENMVLTQEFDNYVAQKSKLLRRKRQTDLEKECNGELKWGK